MVRQVFDVPDDFRRFIRDLAARLYWDEDRSTLSSLIHSCGRGGWLVDDVFEFTYVDPDGHRRWVIRLDERQIHAVAAGVVATVPARELVDREPLLVWGPDADDALRVCRDGDLALALDALAAMAPCVFRLWSITDELIVAALDGNDCALHLVHADGYGTSVGDPASTGTFEVTDADAGRLSIRRADCVSWWVARAALLGFAEGRLDGVLFDARLATRLFAFCAIDHAGELAVRRLAPWDPALSSLPARIRQGAWAERWLARLAQLELVTIDPSIREVIVARLAMLLVRHGEPACVALEVAGELAREVGRLRGVSLAANPHDLQRALRQTAPLPAGHSLVFEHPTPPVV